MAAQSIGGSDDELYLSTERIKQLNAMDKVCSFFTSSIVRRANLKSCSKDIAKLLHSAGLAVKALTKSQQSEGEDSPLPATLESHKEAFTSAASQYFTLLSSIDVRLRRQIYALEEAEIIATDPPAKESSAISAAQAIFGEAAATMAPAQTVSQPAPENAGTTASNLGNLDVGWLNSRNDKVGKQMEAGLWAQARDFVKNLESAKARKDTVEDQK